MDSQSQSQSDRGSSAIDPVCGMTVDPEQAAGSFDYQGQTYFFCSVGCLKKFQADPESYLNQPAAPAITIGSGPVAIPTSRGSDKSGGQGRPRSEYTLSLIHNTEPTRPRLIS
jgi:YHS domain-containing protein